MDRLTKRLEQLFKRVSGDDSSIQNMPDDFIKGWYDGNVMGREAQRKADIKVAKRLLATDSTVTKE